MGIADQTQAGAHGSRCAVTEGRELPYVRLPHKGAMRSAEQWGSPGGCGQSGLVEPGFGVSSPAPFASGFNETVEVAGRVADGMSIGI